MMHGITRRARALVGMTVGLAAAVSTLALATGSSVGAPAPAQVAARATVGGSLNWFVNGGHPKHAYVGGQGLTLTGRLPVAGQRTVWVQSHMNRAGDSWVHVAGVGARTKADGTFAIRITAPDMWGVSYRVLGQGGYATPKVTFDAKTQEVSLWVAGPHPADPKNPGSPIVGRPFTLVADTTPDLWGRPDTVGLPQFTGRVLTFQRRTGVTGWETIGTDRVGAGGIGTLRLAEHSVKNVAYRVRMEDWKNNGSDVGWGASFPTPVRIRAVGEAVRERTPGPRMPGNVFVTGGPHIPKGQASRNFKWYPLYYAYDWEFGQDLNSPPAKGTRTTGYWDQWTNGFGRVSKHNGGIRVDSGRQVIDGFGDVGTTRAWLRNNAATYGRWEMRLRTKIYENRSTPYIFRAELVPARASDAACGRRNIIVGEYVGTSGTLTIGVNAMRAKWRKNLNVGSAGVIHPVLAVEVNKDHITWFLNGKPIGTVKSTYAVSDVPMVPRLSLVAQNGREHNSTSVFADWVRSFPISNGKQVRSAPALGQTSLNTCVE